MRTFTQGADVLSLLAEGRESRQRWHKPLREGGKYVLGRDSEADLFVPWERFLSRKHMTISVQRDGVKFQVLEGEKNPVFQNGDVVTEGFLKPGESIVVGETRFQVLETETATDEQIVTPLESVTFLPGQLRDVRFEDADRRLEALLRLPSVIAGARDSAHLFAPLTSLVLEGIRYAEAVAVISLEADNAVKIAHWDRRNESDGRIRPSTRLVHEALVSQKRPVLHVWDPAVQAESRFTATAELDWAFCIPMEHAGTSRWGLYVAGRFDEMYLPSESGVVAALSADIKFSELITEVLGSVERLKRLEGEVSVLRQFLSPSILTALKKTGDPHGLNSGILEPRECNVTVMFCDLRGFSQQSEAGAQNLHELLDRVGLALEMMTQQILKHGGVTGDFLGDAVLGFWGWPFPSDEAPLAACRAALAIREAFATRSLEQEALAGFQVGIGLAHGRAVAGKIGTSDRVTVTVFGPVVNLASRLEHMTKHLRVPILLDEPLADIVRQRMPAQVGRIRKLAKVVPYGMETPVLVSELVPPLSVCRELTDEHLRSYDQAVDAFLQGDWESAYRMLHQIPSSDRAQDFLTLEIARTGRVAPPGWDGVVTLPAK